MFDIGFWEIVVIGVVALIVFGPERLPLFARRAGYWIGRIRRQVNQLRSEIEHEIAIDEIKQARAGLEAPMSGLAEDIRRATAPGPDVPLPTLTHPAGAQPGDNQAKS